MNVDIARLVRYFSQNLAHRLGTVVSEESPQRDTHSRYIYSALIVRGSKEIRVLSYTRTKEFHNIETDDPTVSQNPARGYIILGVESIEIRPLTFETFMSRAEILIVFLTPSMGLWDVSNYTIGEAIARSAYDCFDPPVYFASITEEPVQEQASDWNYQVYRLSLDFGVENIYPSKGRIYP
jgi:hypothetical protein